MLIIEPFSVYKSKKDWINPSSFKGEDVYTPKHFWAKRNEVQDETLSMAVGTALHSAILTPELFKSEYLLTSNKMFVAFNKSGSVALRDKRNISILDDLRESNPERIVLNPNETEKVVGMVRGLREDLPDLEYFLDRNRSYFEASIYLFARFDKNGNFDKFVNIEVEELKKLSSEEKKRYLPVKTRIDHFHKQKRYASDIKSTQCAHPSKFMYDVIKYGYHIQAPFILDMLNCEFNTDRYTTFTFIVVENQSPYAAIKYNVKNQVLENGREDYINRLEHIYKGYNSGKFRGYEIISQYRTFDNDNNELRNLNTVDLDLPPSYYRNKQFLADYFPFIKMF